MVWENISMFLRLSSSKAPAPGTMAMPGIMPVKDLDIELRKVS